MSVFNNRPDGYVKAVDYLAENNPEYETVVYNLGVPVVDDNIDTAMVTSEVDSSDGDFSLHINDDFLQSNPDYSAATVLIHESVHILMKHLSELARKNDLGFTDDNALMIAHEVLVNDYVYSLGFTFADDVDENGEIIKKARDKYYFGKEWIGKNSLGMSTRQVYELLENSDRKDEVDKANDLHNHSSGSDGTSISPEQAEKIEQGFINGVFTNNNIVPEGFEEFNNDSLTDEEFSAKDDDSVSGTKAGSSFDLRKATILAEQYGTNVEWFKFLNEVNPDFLKGKTHGRRITTSDWVKVNTRATALPNSLKYPSRKGQRGRLDKKKSNNVKPSIVIALDTSGSIPKYMQDRLLTLIETVPKDLIDVRACTFSTRHVEYTGRKSSIASGGTDFSAVESFVRSLDKRPKTVIVITDGMARFSRVSPNPDDYQNYYWILMKKNNRLLERRKNSKLGYLTDFFPKTLV